MVDHWYIACRSKQLKQKPLALIILEQRLVLFRDDAGAVGVLADRCAHRNMALSRGRVNSDGLQCKYHGWTYDRLGTCVRIPAETPEDACNATCRIRIPAYRTVEKQGFIWVYMAQSNIGNGSLTTDIQEPDSLPLDFPMFGERNWQHWVMEREFDGNAFHCVENFLDCPHTAHVHRKLFRNNDSASIELEITSGSDWVQAEFLNEEAMESLVGRLLFPKGAKLRHTDKFMIPYVTRVDYEVSEKRHFIIMSQCTPISENRTRVFTYMAFRFDPIAPLVRLLYQPLASRILNQDVIIIAEQTEDLSRAGGKRFHYHNTDALARDIRDLLAGKALDNKEPSRKRLQI